MKVKDLLRKYNVPPKTRRDTKAISLHFEKGERRKIYDDLAVLADRLNIPITRLVIVLIEYGLPVFDKETINSNKEVK